MSITPFAAELIETAKAIGAPGLLLFFEIIIVSNIFLQERVFWLRMNPPELSVNDLLLSKLKTTKITEESIVNYCSMLKVRKSSPQLFSSIDKYFLQDLNNIFPELFSMKKLFTKMLTMELHLSMS